MTDSNKQDSLKKDGPEWLFGTLLMAAVGLLLTGAIGFALHEASGATQTCADLGGHLTYKTLVQGSPSQVRVCVSAAGQELFR